jgi:hypothetical protein
VSVTIGRRVRRNILSVAFLSAATIVTSSLPVAAANWFEKTFYMVGPRYDAQLPACEAGLGKIQEGFATKESRFWNSSLGIVQFERVREIANRPWVDGSVPRRFCSARALVSDGKWRPVYYSIVEDGGMIGWNWGVTWCVTGLDRNWAYNPDCRMARP